MWKFNFHLCLEKMSYNLTWEQCGGYREKRSLFFFFFLLPFQKRNARKKLATSDLSFVNIHLPAHYSCLHIHISLLLLSVRCKKTSNCKTSIIQLWLGASFDGSDTCTFPIRFESSGSGRTALPKHKLFTCTVWDIKMRWCAWFSQGSESWFCFAGSWAVDRERSNRALFSESWYLSLSPALTHIAQSRTKIHHVYSFTKPSTILILAFAVCTTNYSLLIVRLSGWRKYESLLPSNFSVSLPESEMCSTKKCDTEFVCASPPWWAQSLWVPLSRVPPLCVELHLKCCNTKIEQTAWNGTCGDYSYMRWDSGKSHMNKRWREKPQSLIKFGKSWNLLLSPLSSTLGFINHLNALLCVFKSAIKLQWKCWIFQGFSQPLSDFLVKQMPNNSSIPLFFFF